MSIQNATPSYECGQCDTSFNPPAVKGSFCSTACYDRHRREKARDDVFETIEHDHRFCSTCFNKLKEIARPSELFLSGLESVTREAVIGFQFGTEHAVEGEKAIARDDHRDLVRTSLVCECGNFSHDHSDETLRSITPDKVTLGLWRPIERLRREDKLDVRVDEARFFDARNEGASVRDAVESAIVLE